MTYLDNILDILVQDSDKRLNVPQILKALGKPDYKMVYVIFALKKGIAQNLIKKIENPDAKNMYKDHFYSLVE